MSTPGSGAAEVHGLVSDGNGGWAAPSWDDPIPDIDGPLPAVSEGWLPEVDPLDGGGNGTGPHEFPPAEDHAEPVADEPEQAMRAVQQAQPGTWPTSPLDLAAGPPEPTAPGPDAGPELPVPAPVPASGVTTPEPGRAGGESFTARVHVDPAGDTGTFELSVTGPAAFVSSLVEQFASSFLYQTQNDAS